MTLDLLSRRSLNIPIATGWLLADVGESKGRQDLHYKKEPERLRVLRQNALIESSVSSNRIEGVQIDPSRVPQVILGRGHLTDRDEQEIRGYRDALSWIHDQHKTIPLSVETILRLHYLSHGKVGDAGQLKTRDSDIIENYPDGRSRVRFKTVAASKTSEFLIQFAELWVKALHEAWVPPAVVIAAANLDFLCIHPFRDGNGRVSRLLLLLASYHAGLEVGRYVSLERLIEQNKDRYYETLEQSSTGWHEDKHDPWPYTNYVLHQVKSAYAEFELRIAQQRSPRGAKGEQVSRTIAAKDGPFTLSELERDCPGVSRELIRKVLAGMRGDGLLRSIGRGPGAQWIRIGSSK